MTDPAAVRHLQEHHEGWAPDQPLPAEPAPMAGGPGPADAGAGVAEGAGAGEGAGAAEAGVGPGAGQDGVWATLSYVAAIVLWLIAPLAVYLTRGRRSEFVRRHAAQAFSLTLTVTLFAISAAIIVGLLSIDSAHEALYIMGPVCFVFVVVVLFYLVRAARAASRGEFYQLPAWLCIRTLPS
jgi:uncharacterized Tic20 family protein